MFSKTALAIVNVLIFVVVFTILSGVLLTVLSSNTRSMETAIRRTKAYYAAEAGSIHAFDQMRRSIAPFNPAIEWTYDAAGNPVTYKVANVTVQGLTGPYGSSVLNSSLNYTFNW